eukprot:284818646_2
MPREICPARLPTGGSSGGTFGLHIFNLQSSCNSVICIFFFVVIFLSQSYPRFRVFLLITLQLQHSALFAIYTASLFILSLLFTSVTIKRNLLAIIELAISFELSCSHLPRKTQKIFLHASCQRTRTTPFRPHGLVNLFACRLMLRPFRLLSPQSYHIGDKLFPESGDPQKGYVESVSLLLIWKANAAISLGTRDLQNVAFALHAHVSCVSFYFCMTGCCAADPNSCFRYKQILIAVRSIKEACLLSSLMCFPIFAFCTEV